MSKLNEIRNKVVSILEKAIGISLGVCLFAGGLGFLGYVIAFCLPAEQAGQLCTWLYKNYYGFLIRLGSYTTLACFVKIYLSGAANWKNPFKKENKEK